jgi:uncharacterized damage-inducible protein DinB
MTDDRAANADPRESLPERWNALGPTSNMWMSWDDDPRNSGNEVEGERDTLLDYLRAYRCTLEMKCADLDAEQMARRSVPPSTMSLLGLVRHMADVERNWFRRVMAGQDAPPLYWSDETADADWAGAVADPAVVAEAWQSWRDEVAFAQRYVAETADLGVRGTMRDGSTVALREVIVHMVEEYARHAGHADLLRERIDGRVGQLCPGRPDARAASVRPAWPAFPSALRAPVAVIKRDCERSGHREGLGAPGRPVSYAMPGIYAIRAGRAPGRARARRPAGRARSHGPGSVARVGA